MGFFDGLISGVGDLFGGAPNNAGFQAQSAPITNPVDPNLLAQTQMNAYNQNLASNSFANGLVPGAYQGVQTQGNLTQALQNQANGLGPNPAQAQLAQATGQNIAGQASLAAGQRGASSNVGLIQREAAQQGAGIQQNAIGQASILQAQQQLAAQQQLQQLAAQQIGQGQAGLNSANQATLTNQGQLLAGAQGYNTNQIQNVAQQNQANSNVAVHNANTSAGTLGGAINGIGGFGLNLAKPFVPTAVQKALPGTASISGGPGGAATDATAGVAGATAGVAGAGAEAGPTAAEIIDAGGAVAVAKGGEIPNAHSILAQALANKQMPDHMRSMAEIYHPNVMKKMACGGIAMSKGAEVPGEPKYPGKNTTKQDSVPALLTPKEIVLPLSVTQAKNPGEAAKAFVEHIKGKDHGDFKQGLKEYVKGRKNKK